MLISAAAVAALIFTRKKIKTIKADLEGRDVKIKPISSIIISLRSLWYLECRHQNKTTKTKG